MLPLFPELRPHLEAAFDEAPEGTEFVITRYRDATQNLRTQFTKIVRRAGLTPWDKPFHNLRATRQTELSDEFPEHVVCQWLGNSQAVATKHYLHTTDEHFERAIKAAQKAAQSASELAGNGSQRPETTNPLFCRESLQNKGLVVSKGGRYWTRTNDLHDVNVAL